MHIKSVIIGKGEMPPKCEKCDFCNEWGTCVVLDAKEIVYYDGKDARPPECPLEEEA